MRHCLLRLTVSLGLVGITFQCALAQQFTLLEQSQYAPAPAHTLAQQPPPTTPLPPLEVRPYGDQSGGTAPSGGAGQGGASPYGGTTPFGGGSGQNLSPYGGDTSGSFDAYGNPGLRWDSNLIRSDSTLVGPYAQPQWTTQRPFPTTRAYVLPPGMVEFEQWVRPTWGSFDEAPEYRMLEEVAMGLPGRFQLDLYERWNIEPNSFGDNVANHEGVQIELRWAIADWGVIPLNPTLYAEWIERGGPQDKADKYELKLLLADNLTDRIFYATNFILEQEVEDDRETELGLSSAVGMTIIERKLMAGMELVYQSDTLKINRNDSTQVFRLGPSVQWRIGNRWFLDVVGLFDTDRNEAAQMYIVLGYQFGHRAGPVSGYAGGPISTRGN